MDRISVGPERSTRRDSTRALRVTPKNLADATAFLMLDEAQEIALHESLQDEPLARFLGVIKWLADHEADEGYDPETMLRGWASKRGAGIYREEEEDQPTPAERTQYGSSDEQHREMQEAVSKGGTKPRGTWGVRFTNDQVQRNLDRMSG